MAPSSVTKHALKPTVPHRPLSLHGEVTPGDDQEQLSLSPALHWQEKGSRLRALLNRAIAANRLNIVDLAAETGIDEKQIGRALRDDGGAHPPLALVACVLWRDRSGTFVTGLASMLGYEATPRKPDLAAENRKLRGELADIRSRLDELLSTTT